MTAPATPARGGGRGRAVAGALLLAMVLVAVFTLPLDVWLDGARGWIDRNPLLGRVLFVAGFAVGAACMVPGSVLTMSAGYLFGLAGGVPLALIGSALGAGIAALVSRTLLRGWLSRSFADSRRFQAVDRAIASRGFVIVLLTRLSLLIPYNVLNVMFGLTRIRLVTLVAATALGMVPAVALYVYLGSAARDVTDIIGGQVDTGRAGTVLFVVGLAAVAVATWLIHRTATRALKRELGET